MNPGEIERSFKKLNLEYRIANGISLAELESHETRLGVVFPDQVKVFYQISNGISVAQPPFEIFDMANMSRNESLIAFCKINKIHTVCFDVSCLNEAGQWNIVHSETGYQITKTIASFWANKMMAWIRKEREIWGEEKYS